MTRKLVRFQVVRTRSQRSRILSCLSKTAVTTMANDSAKLPRSVTMLNSPLGLVGEVAFTKRANPVKHLERGPRFRFLYRRHPKPFERSESVVKRAIVTSLVRGDTLMAARSDAKAVTRTLLITLLVVAAFHCLNSTAKERLL